MNPDSQKKMPPESLLKGESFGYTCYSDGAPKQDGNSIKGSLPTLGGIDKDEKDEGFKKSSSNFNK